MTKSVCAAFVLACALLSLPQEGNASLRKGYLRLGFDSTFFRFGVTNYAPKNLEDDYKTAFNLGAGMPNTGIIIGYSALNGFVLGARLNLGLASADDYFDDDHFLAWAAAPFMEYIFLKGVIRPFLTASVGVNGVASYQSDDTWWWGFTFSGGGGIHFFAHQNVSIDLSLLPGFTLGSGKADGLEFKHWRFTVAVPLGISGWF